MRMIISLCASHRELCPPFLISVKCLFIFVTCWLPYIGVSIISALYVTLPVVREWWTILFCLCVCLLALWTQVLPVNYRVLLLLLMLIPLSLSRNHTSLTLIVHPFHLVIHISSGSNTRLLTTVRFQENSSGFISGNIWSFEPELLPTSGIFFWISIYSRIQSAELSLADHRFTPNFILQLCTYASNFAPVFWRT